MLIEEDYKGLILCDDIHLSGNMERFWQWCKNNDNIEVQDYTDIGHSTGTGAIMLS
jgi:hypothetical protein